MNNNVDYKLMRLTSSKCSEYFEAMKIYTQSVEYIQKTSTNEIKYWIDHYKKFALGDLFVFAADHYSSLLVIEMLAGSFLHLAGYCRPFAGLLFFA